MLFSMYFCTQSFLESMIKFSIAKLSMDLLNLSHFYSFLIEMDFSSSHVGGDTQLNLESTKRDSRKCLSVLCCHLNSITSNIFLNFSL